MLAPVLMDVVKLLLWLLLQQVYVMKGLGGGVGGVSVLSCIMQSDVNKTELYSEGEKDKHREKLIERLCDHIDESPTEAWHHRKSSLFLCFSLFCFPVKHVS